MVHILVVDDNKQNLDLMDNLLVIEGVKSTCIESPAKLDAVLGADHFDLVLLDLEMPGSNGYDVFRKLKGDKRLKGVPIVACTVHLSEMNEVRKLGFDGFLGKPLDADLFSEQLAQILNGEQIWIMP